MNFHGKFFRRITILLCLVFTNLWGMVFEPPKPYKRELQDIDIWVVKSPKEMAVRIYQWKRNVWTFPTCGYSAAFYALQMGQTFKNNPNASYQDFTNSFYETDDTDPLTYVNYKPERLHYKKEADWVKVNTTIGNKRNLFDFPHQSIDIDLRLQNPEKSKFFQFCQKAYNLQDPLNTDLDWITEAELSFIIGVFYPEDIRKRTFAVEALEHNEDKIVGLIGQVIEGQSEYAILIYYNGVNHWGAGLIRKSSTNPEKLEMIFTESMGNMYSGFSTKEPYIQGFVKKAKSEGVLRTPVASFDDWLKKAKRENFVLREFADNSFKLNFIKRTSLWEKELKKAGEGIEKQIEDLEKAKSELQRRSDENRQRLSQLQIGLQEYERLEGELQEKVINAFSETQKDEYSMYILLEIDDEISQAQRDGAKAQREALEKSIRESDQFRRENASLIQRRSRLNEARVEAALLENHFPIIQRRIREQNELIEQKRTELEKIDLVKSWLVPELAKPSIDEELKGVLEDLWKHIHLECPICGEPVDKDNKLIFLPCEPEHCSCWQCFGGYIKESDPRIAREYDGEEREPVKVVVHCKPLSWKFIELARKQVSDEDKINFSFAIARFYKLPQIISDFRGSEKFDAENVESRLKDILGSSSGIDDNKVNQLARQIEEYQREIIYPMRFPDCDLTTFISYGVPSRDLLQLTERQKKSNGYNSDDIIFKTIWYGCSFGVLIRANSEQSGVKAKLKFLSDKLKAVNPTPADAKNIGNYMELLLWHGLPVAMLTPLLSSGRSSGEILRDLKNLDRDLRLQEKDILKNLRQIGNKVRFFRDNADLEKYKKDSKKLDRQEYALLNARRQIILQFMKSRQTDKITVDESSKPKDKILEIKDINRELVTQLATFDDFVRENEISGLSQQKIEDLVLKTHEVILEIKKENSKIDGIQGEIYKPAPRYYTVDQDGNMSEDNLKKLETWGNNRLNLVRLEALKEVLIQKVSNKRSLEQKIRAIDARVKVEDGLHAELTELKRALETLRQKLGTLNNKLGVLKRKIA